MLQGKIQILLKEIVAFLNFANIPDYETAPVERKCLDVIQDVWRNSVEP